MPSNLPDLLFATAAAAVILLSLSVVLARNPVRSTLLLILSFLPVSLLYLLLSAPFAGVLQIMVYAGAIMMLFTFVIMMINPAPHEGEMSGTEGGSGRMGGILPGLLLAVTGAIVIPPVYFAAARLPVNPPADPGFGGIRSLSRLLFDRPADNPLTVSFELISVLILVGIVGAVHFSRRNTAGREPSSARPAPGEDAA